MGQSGYYAIPQYDGLDNDGTLVEGGPLALTYRVAGATTLATESLMHRVAIATLDFTTELRHVCVPRSDAATFIEARVKNTSEYELLAGPVSVFMDGGFVTKTVIGASALPVRPN